MLTKKNIVLISLAATAAALLVLTQTAGSNPNGQPNKLEGAWVMTAPGTAVLFNGVFAPNDPSGRSAAVYGALIVRIPVDLMDTNLPHMDSASDYVGEAVMTGPNTARISMIGHGVNKVVPSAQYPFWEKAALVWVAKGELKFTGPGQADCTFTMTSSPVGPDGFPDTTKPAFNTIPGGAKMIRVGL